MGSDRGRGVLGEEDEVGDCDMFVADAGQGKRAAAMCYEVDGQVARLLPPGADGIELIRQIPERPAPEVVVNKIQEEVQPMSGWRYA